MVVVVDYRALSRLNDILEGMLKASKATQMSDDDIMVASDVLKALFNLTCRQSDQMWRF